jgi:DNA-binding MarR family transcriptional regulator
LFTLVYYSPVTHNGKHLAKAHEAIACLQRLSEAFGQRRRQLAESVGLTEQQWSVLEEISSDHFMPSMFAARRQSSRAAVSKTLRQLLDKRLVSVSVSQDDGRQRQYGLTSEGVTVIDRLRRHREAAVTAIWLKVDPKRLHTFTSIGNELTERLSAYGREASEK